jgi:mono/diheme cytochrome c family protein
MPSFKEKLTSEEREDVVNYLRSAFGDLDAPVRPDDTPAAPSVTAE